MAGVHSKFSKFEIKTGVSTWVKVNGVTDFSGIGGGSPSVIDISDLDSTRKEKLIGIPDEGQVSINANYLPADAGQLAVEVARGTGVATDMRATFGSGTGAPVYTFTAFVMSFEPGLGVDKQQSLTFKVEITGSITRALSA